MYRVSSRLSDGRELIYYQAHEPFDPPPDRRGLPAQTLASEVRYDRSTGDRVVIAGHRQTRGLLPEPDDCPLCPSRDGRLTEVPAEDYDVVVFENRFPALTRSSSGRCEVICFSSEHDIASVDLKPDQVRLILDAWTDRTRELGALPGITQVFCFENRGPEMGVTQAHPHGQIYGYPFVTGRTQRVLHQTQQYRRVHNANLFDDIVGQELADGRRVVTMTDEWVAFVPFAARWPYEVHLYPRRRRTDLTGLDEAQRETFASVYLELLRRFGGLFDLPAPYVSAWHQAPNVPDATDFALHLELFTNRRTSERLKMLGGTEVAMDAFSNDVDPDFAAQRLREFGIA